MADIIPTDVTQYLEANGLIQPINGKKWKLSVSTLALTSSNDAPNIDFTLSPTTDKKYIGPFIEIPETLESKETYEFIGFDEDVAFEILERYSNNDPDMPGNFLQFAQYHIGTELDAYTEHDNWDARMESMGVAKALRNAILIPEFDDLRYTQSAKY